VQKKDPAPSCVKSQLRESRFDRVQNGSKGKLNKENETRGTQERGPQGIGGHNRDRNTFVWGGGIHWKNDCGGKNVNGTRGIQPLEAEGLREEGLAPTEGTSTNCQKKKRFINYREKRRKGGGERNR